MARQRPRRQTTAMGRDVAASMARKEGPSSCHQSPVRAISRNWKGVALAKRRDARAGARRDRRHGRDPQVEAFGRADDGEGAGQGVASRRTRATRRRAGGGVAQPLHAKDALPRRGPALCRRARSAASVSTNAAAIGWRARATACPEFQAGDAREGTPSERPRPRRLDKLGADLVGDHQHLHGGRRAPVSRANSGVAKGRGRRPAARRCCAR